MLLPLLAVFACHVVLVTSGPGAGDDVATWRQLLKDQEDADSNQRAVPSWYQYVRAGDGSSEQQSIDTSVGHESDLGTTKRGIAALSQWRPFRASMNRFAQRARIFPISPDNDFISAETRGIVRPVGQPLRWGRR